MASTFWRSEPQKQSTKMSFKEKNKMIYFLILCFVAPGQALIMGIESVLSEGPLENPDHVTEMLFTVELSIGLLSPQLKDKSTRIESSETGDCYHQLSCHLHMASINIFMTSFS